MFNLYNKGLIQITRTIEEMRELFAQRGYNLLSTEYKNNKLPVIFEKDGYKYQNTYNGFIKTDNPKKWGINNPFSLENLSIFLKNEAVRCTVVEQDYNYNSVKLICNCGNEYVVSWNNLITKKQYQCPDCGKRITSAKNRMDDVYLPILQDKGLELLEEYKGCKHNYNMMTSDGYYTRTSPWNVARGVNERDFIFDDGNPHSLDNMKHWLELNTDGVELLDDVYIGAKSRYNFRCFCGNEFSTTWQYFRKESSHRCPACAAKTSLLELKTEDWFNENGIAFIKQKKFDDCKNVNSLRFDYFIPDINLLIEVDGEQHYRPVCFGGVTKERAEVNFKKSKERDRIKDNYCKKHNIKLLRIPYWEYKNNKYKETLKTSTAKI